MHSPFADRTDEAKQLAAMQRMLRKLLGNLRSIAEKRGLEDPERESEKTKRMLLCRIEHRIATLVRDRRYQRFTWWPEAGKPNERWARHLVRLERNLQKRGLKRGSQRLSYREGRTWAVENAAGTKPDELTPVESRAVELLKRCNGESGKKQKAKPRKNIIEERAIRLANSIKRKWFPNSRNSKLKGNCAPVLLSSGRDVALDPSPA